MAGLLPYRRPINVVVGRPIQVEQQAKPDDGYIDEVHQKYMASLFFVFPFLRLTHGLLEMTMLIQLNRTSSFAFGMSTKSALHQTGRASSRLLSEMMAFRK